MDIEKRLKEAEDLLKQFLDEAVNELKHPELTSTVKQFLQPEIDFDKMPVGTNILIDRVGGYTFSAGYSDKSILAAGRDHSIVKDKISLPDHQLSHIHKIKWPEDGERPDFVNYDDLIIGTNGNNKYWYSNASDVSWIDPCTEWYAILKVSDYIKL